MDTLETLTWLRDNGAHGLVDHSWSQVGGWTHGNPRCRHLENVKHHPMPAALEDLAGQNICSCAFVLLDPRGGDTNTKPDSLLYASRIRIALEHLEDLLQDPVIDESGRYPNFRAAALRNVATEVFETLDSIPDHLARPAESCRQLWQTTIDAHPLDLEAFDEEILARAAWQITDSVVYDRLLNVGLLESQGAQVLYQEWRNRSATCGHRHAAEELGIDDETRTLLNDWVRTFENNVVDDEPRACYIGSPATRVRPGEPASRKLVIGRGLRTGLTRHGYADSAFGVYPNVVARTLKRELPAGRDRRMHEPESGGAVMLLPLGLPELTEDQWETAIALWAESFSAAEEEPIYRDFVNAITAASGL